MTGRRSNVFMGFGALVALAVLGYLLLLFLSGSFKSGIRVTAEFNRAGQLLRSGSDVKLRGVLVGEVMVIDQSEPGRARIGLRLFEDQVQHIPANIGAAIRAKTLFGEKYVDLNVPDDPEGRISDGDTIPNHRTVPPIEVETVLEKALPLLEAIDAEQLSAALRALTQGFVGNEEALRRATDQGVVALEGTERTLPNLENNLVHLRNFASSVDEIDQNLIDALAALELVGRAVERSRDDLPKALDNLTRLTGDLADISEDRAADLALLAEEGTPILEFLESKAPEVPALARVLDGFLANWVADLSAGPFWRIFVDPAPIEGAHGYPPGQEPQPRSTDPLGARTQALARLSATGTDPPPRDLLDILLAPVPTDGLLDLAGAATGAAP